MIDGSEDRLPATSRQAVHDQFAQTFKPPYESPITIAVNGALMSSAWFFLPAGLRDKVFTLHGRLAFALVLAAWMIRTCLRRTSLGLTPCELWPRSMIRS
jgi:hypothetical protein